MHTNMYSISEDKVESFLKWLDSLSDERFVNIFKQEKDGTFRCFVNDPICRKDFSQLIISTLKSPQRVVMVNSDNPKLLDFINLGTNDIVIRVGKEKKERGISCSYITIDDRLYKVPKTFSLCRK